MNIGEFAMKFHKWGQLLIIGVVTSIAGCRYEAVDANADVVDYIIRGDARGAAKCCSFPLDLNRVSPLISIDNVLWAFVELPES